MDKASLPLEQIAQKFNYVEIIGQQAVNIPVGNLIAFLQALKDEYQLDYLTNLTGADYPEENKIQLIYNLCSIEKGYTLMIRTDVERDNAQLPSVFPIWGGANWQEREVYDLLGVWFTGHPNLKRILLDPDFEGYPLRKDYRWEKNVRE